MKKKNIKTLEGFVRYLNRNDEWPADASDIIASNGWIDDTAESYGVCHTDTEKVILDDDLNAIIVEAA